MDNNERQRPAYLRGIGRPVASRGPEGENVPVPAKQRAAIAARKEIAEGMRFMAHAGAIGLVGTQIQRDSQPAPQLTRSDPAPDAVTNSSAAEVAGVKADQPVIINRTATPRVRKFVADLPPIVGKPLKWGVPIGIGLYALGHEKLGLIVGALGAARWALVRGYLGNV